MKVQLLRKSAPFFREIHGLRFRDSMKGLYITFLAKVENQLESEIKQFFCVVDGDQEKAPIYFSTLLFAKEGDILEVLPYHYENDPSDRVGFGSKVIDVKNLSHPEFNANPMMQAYQEEWVVKNE